MTIRFDDNFFSGIGLTEMPGATRRDFTMWFRECLETRVGNRLVAELTSNQLNEFGTVVEQGSGEEAVAWLAANCPDYKEVVQSEFETFCDEIRSRATEFLAVLGLSGPDAAVTTTGATQPEDRAVDMAGEPSSRHVVRACDQGEETPAA